MVFPFYRTTICQLEYKVSNYKPVSTCDKTSYMIYIQSDYPNKFFYLILKQNIAMNHIHWYFDSQGLFS